MDWIDDLGDPDRTEEPLTREELAYRRGPEFAELQARARRMRDEVALPDQVRACPDAADVLPNPLMCDIDKRKFAEYSLNPQHPANGGKAEGWRALGYDVDNPLARRDATWDLQDLLRCALLPQGKVVEVTQKPDGPRYRVENGFIGPNDRHARLVTCWQITDSHGYARPRLITTWVRPYTHTDTEAGTRDEKERQ